MKTNLYLIIFTACLVVGCKSYVQVYNTKSINAILENDFFVYETDTLKITYSFWAKGGVLSFVVFNKLNNPIYIDWKKSSYIDNTNKLNYWVDIETTEIASFYGAYFYNGPTLRPGLKLSQGYSVTGSTKLKPERITFIPPQSNYYRTQFYINPNSYFILDVPAESREVSRNDNPRKKTIIYEKVCTKATSPLIFRNFLTFSLSEDFDHEFYVDNEFFLSKIMEMNFKHFKFIVGKKDGELYYSIPFKQETSFYFNIPKEESVEQRIRK